MLLEYGGYTISFELGHAVHTAFPDSAVGKTFTAKLLKSISALERDDILVIDYEYAKHYSSNQLIDKIKSRKYSLIFADRADRWCTEDIYETLWDADTIVYADFKDCNPDDMYGLKCNISFTNGSIRYYENNI